MKKIKPFIFLFFLNVCINPLLIASIKKDTIYIYHDLGVSHESLQETLFSLENLLNSKYHLKTIDAKGVMDNHWSKNAKLFIMPGGADIPYLKKLKGKGNESIRNFVYNGGSYLGLCAGAYYGASMIEFDKDGPLEVTGKRELNFYPGIAKGPILATYHYDSQKGARAALITPHFDDLKKAYVFYNGGSTFLDIYKYPATTILATYQNNQPAIIQNKVGKGVSILSGVHIEYSPHLLDDKDNYLKNIKAKIEKTNIQRKQIFKAVIMKLID